MKLKTILLSSALLLGGFGLFLAIRPKGDDPDSVRVFPGANSRETYFTLHQIREAQAISKGKGCKIGILDHSFGMAHHPKLYAGGANFVPGNDDFLQQRQWHGYWMATVLREIAPEVEIYALNTRTFKNRQLDAGAIARAVEWAIDNHLDVLTYSAEAFEGESQKILNKALNRAHTAGIITTFIHTGHPRNILPSGLFSGQDDGREPDVNIFHFDYTVVALKPWNNQPFLSISSTSPVLGGVVAMMKSAHPSLTLDQCQKILRDTAHAIDFHGEKPPRSLDAFEAVKRAKELP
jgi:hypothetical protein